MFRRGLPDMQLGA